MHTIFLTTGCVENLVLEFDIGCVEVSSPQSWEASVVVDAFRHRLVYRAPAPPPETLQVVSLRSWENSQGWWFSSYTTISSLVSRG